MISLNELLFPDQLENDLMTNIKGDLQIDYFIKRQEQLDLKELEAKINTE